MMTTESLTPVEPVKSNGEFRLELIDGDSFFSLIELYPGLSAIVEH